MYFNVNLKLLTKLINSAFVGLCVFFIFNLSKHDLFFCVPCAVSVLGLMIIVPAY